MGKEPQTSEIFRRRTAMVIYAVEVAFVQLMRRHNHPVNSETITFGEILQDLTRIQVTEAEAKTLRELKQFADALELASIRNACAHPVREFYLFQWYRVACFASDPRVHQLSLVEVAEALACAEAGQLSDPPEEWLDKIRIPALPNNLPKTEKFDSTGLIGRNRESDSLLADLSIGRVNTIALVGPGGVGKTSVAIDVARRIADDVGATRRFDGIVYLSFKVRDLTAKGVVNLDNSVLTSDISEQLLEAIQKIYQVSGMSDSDIVELAAKDNLLVILDNFEDLFLEKSSACEVFLNGLPSNWKVLISSRVSVDAAKNIPIKGLAIGAIEGLARKYYEAVTGKGIDSDTLEKIKIACNGNPLALKLMIDRISLGHSAEDAKSITQNDILDYSFGSLVQSLIENQKSLLECIFVLGQASRVALLELTEFSPEELIDSQNILIKTSLIEHSSSGTDDFLVISSSVRELLARSPLNLELRSFYSKKLNSIRVKGQGSSLPGIIDTFNFDSQTPPVLKKLGGKLPKLWAHQAVTLTPSDEEYIRNFEEQIVKYESACRGFEDYYRLRAYSRALLRDSEMALTFARHALEIAPNSLVASQLFANLLISSNRNLEAREVLAPVVKDLLHRIGEGADLLHVYGPNIVREIFSAFFKTFIWSGEYDQVIQFTEPWAKTPDFLKIIFVISRSASLRRMHERAIQSDTNRCEALTECARLLTYCFRELGTPVPPLVREANKVRAELCSRILAVSSEYRASFILAANTLTRHLGDSHPLMQSVDLSPNVDRIPKTAVLSEIYSIKSTYCFSRDESGAEFFVPFSVFEGGRVPHLNGEKIYVWDLAVGTAANGTTRAGAAHLV